MVVFSTSVFDSEFYSGYFTRLLFSSMFGPKSSRITSRCKPKQCNERNSLCRSTTRLTSWPFGSHDCTIWWADPDLWYGV